MKTIQIVLPESLLRQIDKQCGARNRSAFFRQAVEDWFKSRQIADLEQRQIAGYKKHPVQSGEFDSWLSEQAWPD
jgi:Arc/MetJ-type ribon-helix-helix transcriptional regulator